MHSRRACNALLPGQTNVHVLRHHCASQPDFLIDSAMGSCARRPTCMLQPATIYLQRPNIRYIHTAAEYLGSILPPQSVDLVAIAETLHW